MGSWIHTRYANSQSTHCRYIRQLAREERVHQDVPIRKLPVYIAQIADARAAGVATGRLFESNSGNSRQKLFESFLFSVSELSMIQLSMHA